MSDGGGYPWDPSAPWGLPAQSIRSAGFLMVVATWCFAVVVEVWSTKTVPAHLHAVAGLAGVGYVGKRVADERAG